MEIESRSSPVRTGMQPERHSRIVPVYRLVDGIAGRFGKCFLGSGTEGTE